MSKESRYLKREAESLVSVILSVAWQEIEVPGIPGKSSKWVSIDWDEYQNERDYLLYLLGKLQGIADGLKAIGRKSAGEDFEDFITKYLCEVERYNLPPYKIVNSGNSSH